DGLFDRHLLTFGDPASAIVGLSLRRREPRLDPLPLRREQWRANRLPQRGGGGGQDERAIPAPLVERDLGDAFENAGNAARLAKIAEDHGRLLIERPG